MNAPFRWAFPLVAIAAALVAIAVGSDESVAVGAATIAIVAAGLGLWDSVRGRAAAVVAPNASPDPPTTTQQWFDAGELGQEALVLLLDRIDRALVHTELPNRSAADLARLRRLPREEFLRYLDRRIGELEAAT